MGKHNYKLNFNKDPQNYLNRDTYCPMEKLTMELFIVQDGQHDGYTWTESFKNDCERRLVEYILDDIKQQVERFVQESNPFSIHLDFSKENGKL